MCCCSFWCFTVRIAKRVEIERLFNANLFRINKILFRIKSFLISWYWYNSFTGSKYSMGFPKIFQIEISDSCWGLSSSRWASGSKSPDGWGMMLSLHLFPRYELDNRFDVDSLTKFVLTVRKNYRAVPYHNWTHAFAVAHSMYCLIRHSKGNISGLEAVAL